jgi:hypothetical protein
MDFSVMSDIKVCTVHDSRVTRLWPGRFSYITLHYISSIHSCHRTLDMKHVKEFNSSIEHNQQSIRTAQHTYIYSMSYNSQ